MSFPIVSSQVGYPVTIVDSGGFPVTLIGGGGGELPSNQAIVTDGEIVTAVGGQTVDIQVTDNVASLTIKNWAFWQPFTMTVGEEPGEDVFGYVPEEFGSISNEPVAGFSLRTVLQLGTDVEVTIAGPHPIAGELEDAVVGISAANYSPVQIMSSLESEGVWVTSFRVQGVSPAWTVGRQIPFVIIPQN